MSQFDRYSQYYDLFYGQKQYGPEASYVADLLGSSGKSLRILELGCGTGGHALQLAVAGHDVVGIDLSQRMIERANARLESLPSGSGRLQFEHGDIRTWRTDQRFDAVISLFHVMSYQTDNSDLTSAFATAAHHLLPGGRFVFDYWFGPGVLSIGPSVMVRRATDEGIAVTRIAEPTHDPVRNCVSVAFDIFVAGPSGSVDRIQEVHRMRYLFAPEIELMGSQQFEAFHHYGWLKTSPPMMTDWAAVAVMTKT